MGYVVHGKSKLLTGTFLTGGNSAVRCYDIVNAFHRIVVDQWTYFSLLQVSFRVQYPQDYADLSREDLKDFKKTRYGIKLSVV